MTNNSTRNIPEELKVIAHEVTTQDNRITRNPLFIVQQKREIAGVDADHGGEMTWYVAVEWDVVTEAKLINALNYYYEKNGEPLEGYHYVGSVHIWEFVTACLTLKGCEDYLRINGHNLNKPRIYVEGGYRNREWELMREFFAKLEAGEIVVLESPEKVEGWRCTGQDSECPSEQTYCDNFNDCDEADDRCKPISVYVTERPKPEAAE